MKNKLFLGILSIIGIAAFSFDFSSKEAQEEISINALKVMNASAGELYCKPAANPCYIDIGSVTIIGSGQLTANY